MKNIFLIIMCHLIGDYALQSEYIATTKGTNWYHLFVHCMLYILPFYMCFGFTWQLIILFSTHCMVDALKARYHKITYSIDQIVHYATLLILYL